MGFYLDDAPQYADAPGFVTPSVPAWHSMPRAGPKRRGFVNCAINSTCSSSVTTFACHRCVRRWRPGGELSVDTMSRMFLCHEYDGAVFQHKDTRPPGIYPITVKIWVMAPALGKLWVRFYKDGRPPCQNEPVEVIFDPWPCKGAILWANRNKAGASSLTGAIIG